MCSIFAPQSSSGKTEVHEPFLAHIVVGVLACMIREEGKQIALPTAGLPSVHLRQLLTDKNRN